MYLSTDQLQKRFEHDLLLLGGPKNSKVVADFLNLIADYQPLAHSKNQFIWREASVAGWSADKVEELLGEIEGERLVQDYGVIIRTANPFTSQHRTVTLIAGSHTAGVTAAAKYLTQDIYRDFSFRVLKDCNIAAVVSATIRDDYPVAITTKVLYMAQTGSKLGTLAAAVREQYIKSKTGHSEDCEDLIYVSDQFFAVIDGTTSKTDERWNGATGGQVAARVISQTFSTIPAGMHSN